MAVVPGLIEAVGEAVDGLGAARYEDDDADGGVTETADCPEKTLPERSPHEGLEPWWWWGCADATG